MVNFAESGHPVFRATSLLSQGTLKSKGGGKLSIHLCADGETIETVFRTIISVNQLSICQTISDVRGEHSVCQARTVRLVMEYNLTHCSSQQVRWWKHLHLRPMILRKKIYCKSTKNEWKGYHKKIVWSRFVLMQDSRQQSDSTSWQRTLTRKVGFEGTPELGPYWKSQQATYKVNIEWKLELNL